MIITETQDALVEFELWHYDSEAVEYALIPAGPRGDKARALEAPGSRCVWRVRGKSHIDVMTQYYAHQGWGAYHSDWPDLDAVPYFYTYAMETLSALPKGWKPLREIKIMADGSTKPPVPGAALPMISIQDGKVTFIGVWVFGDFGGHGEPPLNAQDLIAAAEVLIAKAKPYLFKRRSAVFLICPAVLAEQMYWVSLERTV